MQRTILEKLKSRKLWAAIAGLISGLSIIFGVDTSVSSTVSGAVVSVASIITYIITEGKIDAARAAATLQKVQEAVTVLTEDEGAGDQKC